MAPATRSLSRSNPTNTTNTDDRSLKSEIRMRHGITRMTRSAAQRLTGQPDPQRAYTLLLAADRRQEIAGRLASDIMERARAQKEKRAAAATRIQSLVRGVSVRRNGDFRSALRTRVVVNNTAFRLFPADENPRMATGMKRALRAQRGHTVRVVYHFGHNVLVDTVVSVPSVGFNKWFDIFYVRNFMEGGYANDILQLVEKASDHEDWQGNKEMIKREEQRRIAEAMIDNRIIIARNALSFTRNQREQLFAEGIEHCVFTPILNWARGNAENATSKRSQRRTSEYVKKCTKLAQKYTFGVPESKMNEIVDELHIDIHIEYPFTTNRTKYECVSGRRRIFTYMNTRMDHLEHNELVNNSKKERIECTVEDMQTVLEELRAKKKWFTYTKRGLIVSSIQTLTTNYTLKDAFRDAVTAFEGTEETELCNFKIDDIADTDLTYFVQEGTHYNSCVDFHGPLTPDMESDADWKHIDMKSAYASFRDCKHYGGFVGKFHHMCRCDKIHGIGYYRIDNVRVPNNRYGNYAARLGGIYTNLRVYPSVELKALKEWGFEFDIVEGAWGSNVEWDFPDFMMNNKTDDRRKVVGADGTTSWESKSIRYYCKWAGIQSVHSKTKTIWMDGDKDFFDALKWQVEDPDSVFWADGGDNYTSAGSIRVPKASNMHLEHILGFILSYVRITMIEQLNTMDPKDVYRIASDGIYYKGDYDYSAPFRIKDDRKFGNVAGLEYISPTMDTPFGGRIFDAEFKDTRTQSNILFIGAGGCGKTYEQLTDSGLVKPLYCSPTWRLAREKENESGVRGIPWARLVNSDPQKRGFVSTHYNTLIVDEVSQMQPWKISRILQLYPHHLIYFCGDVGYQCAPVFSKEDPPPHRPPLLTDFGCPVVEFTNNRRCECDRLLPILKSMRDQIGYANANEAYHSSQFKEDAQQCLVDNFPTITEEELGHLYTSQDIVLVATTRCKKCRKEDCNCDGHNLVKHFTDALANNDEKWLLKSTTRTGCNGDVIIGQKPTEGKAQLRHAFTIHLVQGLTCEEKIFIVLDNFFDPRMAYTAVSRARRHHQITLVKPNITK